MAQAISVESEIPVIVRPVGGWMRCRPFLVARRAAILDALSAEAAHLSPSDHGLRKARLDALRVFDSALAELFIEELDAEPDDQARVRDFAGYLRNESYSSRGMAW